jgi:hypothetical protein
MFVFKSEAKDASGEGHVLIRLFVRMGTPSISLKNTTFTLRCLHEPFIPGLQRLSQSGAATQPAMP